MPKCPFETTEIICLECGENRYNVDGSETRSSSPEDLLNLGIRAVALYVVLGGRCDSCGNPVGYVPKPNSLRW